VIGRRIRCGLALVVACAACAVPSARAAQPPGATIRIHVGGHALAGGAMLPEGFAEAREQGGGVRFGVSTVGPWGQRFALGGGAYGEHNRVAWRDQSFNAVTLRPMVLAEMRRVGSAPARTRRDGAYARLGLGWNFNMVGTTVTYLAGAPAGTPLGLDLLSGPAVEAAVGMHLFGNREGALNLEAGWALNSGRRRVQVSAEPDQSGNFDLSGFFVQIGVSLWFGPPDPADDLDFESDRDPRYRR
jgi:hypothetical protein